jgi:hypothetical protein
MKSIWNRSNSKQNLLSVGIVHEPAANQTKTGDEHLGEVIDGKLLVDGSP